MARLRWLITSALVGASPLCGLTILRTDRLSGLHNRLLALKCLTLVRLYRASLMFCLALHRDTEDCSVPEKAEVLKLISSLFRSFDLDRIV